MQPLQRKFLLQALEFYKEFAKQKNADPETEFETARRLPPRRQHPAGFASVSRKPSETTSGRSTAREAG